MTGTLNSLGVVTSQAGTGGSSSSTTVTVIIIAVLVVLAVAVLLFVGLILLRLLGSYRERRLEEKKKRLSPLIYDLLTEGGSPAETVARLESSVPPRDRKALELVLLEHIRFLKGGERESLKVVFDEMGYADEDIRNLARRGMVRKAESAFHLGTMRSEKAVPALEAALKSSKRSEVEFSCLNALSKIGTDEALEAVVDYLAAAPELETLRVAEVILERKQEFTGYLEQWLERGEPGPGRLLLLVDLMGAMQDAHAVPLLERFLQHEEAGVRARAALALGNIGDFTVCDELVAVMEDADPAVRSGAAESLGKLQCDAAIPRLKQGLGDDDVSVRLSCAAALSEMGEAGRAVLTDALLTAEESQYEAVAEVLTTMEARGKQDEAGT